MSEIPRQHESQEPAPFDLGEYLEKRQTAQSFVIVEFGHGPKPVGPRQPNLTGQRAYIGIETWQDPGIVRTSGQYQAQLLLERRGNNNIFFINNELPEREPTVGVFERANITEFGDYDPTTGLPDGAAHESVLINVFGDFRVGFSREHTGALLDEVKRVTDDHGEIVIRETYSPQFTIALQEQLDQGALTVDAMVTRDDTEMWGRLEELFGDPGQYVPSDSFYLFLSKPR